VNWFGTNGVHSGEDSTPKVLELPRMIYSGTFDFGSSYLRSLHW